MPSFESSASISASGTYPALLPLDELQAGPEAALDPQDPDALKARAAALQQRGAGLAAAESETAPSPRLEAALARPAP